MIYVRLCKLPVDIKLIKLGKGEHKTVQYRSMNKHEQVPVLVETSAGKITFVLPESQAIMIYLAERFKNECKEYYGETNEEKAEILAAMQFGHANIRASFAGVSWNAFVAKNMGAKLSLEMSLYFEEKCKVALRKLEDKWLGAFMSGRAHASIADLLIVEDIVNLQLLRGSPFREKLQSLESLLEPYPKTRQWIDAIKNLEHGTWNELHQTLERVSNEAKQRLLTSKL